MLLKRLSEAPAVSGNETAARDVILEEVRRLGLRVETDTIGNVIVRAGSQDAEPACGNRIMLAAHMDEVGLIVTYIEKDGFIRFGKVGGIDDRVLPAKEVLIGPDRIRGVIGLKPIHLQEPDERKKAVKSDRLMIDIGARSREEAEKKVKPGDYASFRCEFEPMGQRTVKGKALDDRVGCAILLRVLEKKYSFPVAGVFTVQEEIGLRGATVAAWSVEPDMALVLEGTICSDTPGTDEHLEATRLGQGPALSIMDGATLSSKSMLKQLVRVAGDRGIPYQFKRSTMGGNDAGRIHLSKTGVPAASVSVPSRYIHSPASIVSLDDYENAVRLVQAFLDSVEEGFLP